MNNKTKQYKRSKFNTAASRRGMDAEEFASMVLANPSEYSQETINKAKYMLPKYGIGGDILGGAASGAGAGATVGGPWGAVIGGVAGAVGGLFSGKKREQEEREALDKQRKTNMANSARQGRFAEMQSEQQYNYAPVFAYGGYMENPPTGMRTVLDETTVTNEGKVQGDFYKPATTVTTSNYQPISRRTYYLENKRAGIIPESVTFEKFSKDFDKYSPKSEDYKYDNKSGKVYKNFPETQITEEDKYNYQKLGVKPPMKGRYVAAGNIQTKMAYGGDITGMPNVEVEGDESIQMPDGESFMPQGPSHAQGGIPMELPNNTRVFSKKLNVPGTKNKFSEIHGKTSKKIKNYEDMIDDPYATPVAKQTAKRMVDKLRNRQDVLFETQQALNGNNNNTNQMLPKAEEGMRVGNNNPTHADLLKFINDSYDERKRNYATIGNKEPDWEKLLEQQRQVTLSRANSPEILNNPNSWNKIISTVNHNTNKQSYKRELPKVPSFYSTDEYSQYQPSSNAARSNNVTAIPVPSTVSNYDYGTYEQYQPGQYDRYSVVSQSSDNFNSTVPGYNDRQYSMYQPGSYNPTTSQSTSGRFDMSVPGYDYNTYSQYTQSLLRVPDVNYPQGAVQNNLVPTTSATVLVHPGTHQLPTYDASILNPVAQQANPQIGVQAAAVQPAATNTPVEQPVSADATRSIMQPTKPKGTSTVNLTSNNGATNPVDTKTLAKMPANTPAPRSGNFGNTVTGIAQALPAVYNIAQGLFGKADTLDANDYTNPYEGAAIKAMQNRKYNIDPMLEANRVAYSTANRNLASAARTRGELLSGYGASAYGKSMADMQAWATKNNEENRYSGDMASMYANLGQQRASNQMYVSDYNARSRAAKQNLIGTGITQVGQLAQNYALNRNRSQADEMRTKALQQMYSNYNFNPTTGEWEVK